MSSDPLEDILVRRQEVFSSRIDNIVWGLAELFAEQELRALVDWLDPPPLDELERKLQKIKEQRLEETKERAWDTSRISKDEYI